MLYTSYLRILVREKLEMNEVESKQNIRKKIEEAEARHTESIRLFDMLEDFYSRSLARTREALDNSNLNPIELEALSELETNCHRFSNSVAEERDNVQFEFQNQIEKYHDELETIEKNGQNKEGERNDRI